MPTTPSDVDFVAGFQHPECLYRDMPFWGWNGELNREQIVRQISVFRRMGMGGFHIHSRSGLSTEYLGQTFLDMVKLSVEEARANGLYVWLYDEDRYPSGYGGGMVTQDARFICRSLQIYIDTPPPCSDKGGEYSGELLCCYQIRFDRNNRLSQYRTCACDEAPHAESRKMWCYKVLASPSAWFNNRPYFDALNHDATMRFLQVTHERYLHAIGHHFGHSVPAIFTDEPCHHAFVLPKNTAETGAVAVLPFTDTLPASYMSAYSEDVFATLPEVLWEKASGYSQARYRYHNHVAELFSANYTQTIGEWCTGHGIMFSGHMLGESSLEAQSASTGDVMRHYRHFDIPGVDVLCDSMELATVKQCQSVCRQNDKVRMASELDGVTDWDFPFFCHKGHGDWQAALGVTLRIPHHALMSLGGEAKRDYPASIGEQSPWHEKYPLIADHFARINFAMSRGAPCCRVGIIHPIESYWLACGPQEQTARSRRQMEENFQDITEFLLYGLMDFDFIAESLLPHQSPSANSGRAFVGKMIYEVLLVPSCLTLRSSTVGFLEECLQHGVRVILVGMVPELVDAAPSARIQSLVNQCERILFTRQAILDALEPYRDIAITNLDTSEQADRLLYQLRVDKDGARLLFIANTDRIGLAFRSVVRLRGMWQLEELNTSDGVCVLREASMDGEDTVFQYCFPPHGHLLLKLTPAKQSRGQPFDTIRHSSTEVENAILCRVPGRCVPVTLNEPNVMLLDLAEWRIHDNPIWNRREEILRIENHVRSHHGIPPRNGVSAQPWCMEASDRILGALSLRFVLDCDVAVDSCELAGEQLGDWYCELDDQPLALQDNGYWCDQAIRRARMPRLEAGRHIVTLNGQYGSGTVLEPFYLLGKFGVRVIADTTKIIAPIDSLSWGDITCQGLPFYGGTVTYHVDCYLEKGGKVALRIPSRMIGYGVPAEIRDNHATREIPFSGFAGVLATVSINGKKKGDIAFAPFQLSLGYLPHGHHQVDLTLYTHRRNCLGALHQSFRSTLAGPDTWRLAGDEFSNTYRLCPAGILLEPLILCTNGE